MIIDDSKLSYKYLNNNSKTIYQIDEDISDDDSDIISSFDFPVLYIEFKENLNFDDIESFFKLTKISNKKNITDLNKSLMNIQTEKKKLDNFPDLSNSLSSLVEDDFDE